METIWRRYAFDRHLRLILMDAIERIEVSIRTHCVTNFTRDYGPFGYLEQSNLPKINKKTHELFLKKLSEEASRSREKFKNHFFSKYGDEHKNLPLWMAIEIMSFGMMLTLYNGLENKLKQEIAAQYKVSDSILSSWLLTLNVIRNICAHHGRLWNREIGCKPIIPRENKHPEWHIPIKICNKRIFAILTILKYMLNTIAPQSKWPSRFIDLLNEYNEIPRAQMGFDDKWKECPIWKV